MAPKRIQRKRDKGWRMPAGTRYVGRPTIYGNPFIYGERGRLLAVDMFEKWIGHDTLDPRGWGPDLIVAHTHLKAALARGDLAGWDLACWCPLDRPCHADVLLRLANPDLTEEKP
jgi:hypothetical protein